jgi:hypothetical protein
MRKAFIRLHAGLRGLGIVPLLIAVLVALAPLPAARAAAPEGLIVDLFFNLADGTFAEPGALPEGLMPEDGELQIAGIPLRINAGVADAGWSTVAGGNGRYVLPGGGPIGVVAKARVTRTDFFDTGAPGTSAAMAATDFSYAQDGWTLGLEPGVEIVRWDSRKTRWDARLDSRFSRALVEGLSLAGRAQYRWFQVRGLDPVDGRIVSGRLGFICALFAPMRLDVAYIMQHEVVTDLDDPGLNGLSTSGPSVAVTLPLGENLDFSATYDLTATHRTSETESVSRRLHRMVAAMTWDLGLDFVSSLSARYSFENPSDARAYHAGMVNFGMTF